MPALRSHVVALLVADLHLSYKPPVARADERSWFGAMERSLSQLRNLQAKHKDSIVLCAGDIFDRWNSPPELINWALERLPQLHAIPGNHDLPNHRPELAYRSAYGTLTRAGKITELCGWPVLHRGFAIYGRPFGEEIPSIKVPDLKQVLVTHEYLWTSGTGHDGASKESKLSTVAKSFRGFDVVVVVDNHVPFERVLRSGTQVVNCGGFLRRRSNEQDHQPRIGLLHSSGAVTFHPLDCGEDKLSTSVTSADEIQDEAEDAEVASFVEALSILESTTLCYRENLEQAMREGKTRPEVRDARMEAMDS